MVEKNKIYRAAIIDYTAEGFGTARVQDMVVFVPGTAVGDQCDIRITRVTSRMAYGRIERIVVPSKHRIRPACPLAGKCGGCCWQHISYEEELRAKQKKVTDALRRIGGVTVEELPIVGAPQTEHYRNKAQYPVGLSADGDIITGFYRTRSHDIIAAEQCLIQSETADRLAGVVRQWMTDCSIVPYDEAAKKGIVRHIYVRVGVATGEAHLCIVAARTKLPAAEELIRRAREACPSLTGVVLNINKRTDNVILGDRTVTLWGEPELEDRLCGSVFRLSPHAFYQVNHDQAERLYACVLEFASLTGTETVLDLCCGAGTITLALAQKAGQVTGIEIVPEAVENARGNAARNGIENVSFYCADAAQAAVRFAHQGKRPDVIVVDPPRKGLDTVTIEAAAQMAPQRIVYVSCDSATLARDVKLFAVLGYHIEKARAFDLFPRTRHVETVCLLSKLKAEHHIEVDLNLDELDLTAAESKATDEEIKAYVLEKFGLKVSNLYISQVKRKCGLEVGVNYNLPKSENTKVPICPPEREKAIMAALAHFRMI